MGDDRLRSCERRWRETGAPEDGRVLLVELERAGATRPRLLRARVDVGDLPEARLRLAAFLGDEDAQEALAVRFPRAYVENVCAWVNEVGAWGPEPWPRVAVTMARLLQREFHGESPPEPWLGRAADAVEALLDLPGALAVSEVLELIDEGITPEIAPRTCRLNIEAVTRHKARFFATFAARNVAEVALALAERRPVNDTRGGAREATQRTVEALIYADIARLHETLVGDLGPAWDEAQAVAHARVRACVQTALLPWALGR